MMTSEVLVWVFLEWKQTESFQSPVEQPLVNVGMFNKQLSKCIAKVWKVSTRIQRLEQPYRPYD
jgi:hypothetical protein